MLGLFDSTVYSFLDLSGAIAHPLTGSFVFTEGGVGQIIVMMTTEKTFHEISVEGVVCVGKIPASNGKLQIHCQQTSNIHKWLLYNYNTIFGADASEWAKMSATLRNVDDGTSHSIGGISFEKIPDKAYAAQGGLVIWNLAAADIQSLAPNPSFQTNAISDFISEHINIIP